MDSRLCIAFIAAFVSFRAVDCLECYACGYMMYESKEKSVADTLNSQLVNDAECELNGETYTTDSRATSITCSSNVCAKLDYDVDFDYEGHEVKYTGVQRTCGISAETGCKDALDTLKKSSPYELSGEAEECTCDTEKCNTASGLSAGLVAVFLSALSGIWMK